MKYFFHDKNEIIENLRNRRALIFLDYDGTLVPIRKTPKLAVLNLKTKELLRQISKKYFIAIISGRTLSEIKKLVGLKNIIYSGNHGFEIEIKGRKTVQDVPLESKKEIHRIKNKLIEEIKKIGGAFLEDKGLTLSVHWRLVGKKYLLKLFAIIRDVIRNGLCIHLTKGKKVWEIRPNINWDKGRAVRFVMSKVQSPKSKVVPIYIGDDITDEDVFKILKNGITIRVGKSKKSKAKYYIKNQSEIKKLLNHLIA
ncbi:MAG: trehalose-phosphatase [Elusimicrobia bacterium]|nr:trehalose-phosphatase [Elusimicrobiota bacterium]